MIYGVLTKFGISEILSYDCFVIQTRKGEMHIQREGFQNFSMNFGLCYHII